jgi:hypothetical protein
MLDGRALQLDYVLESLAGQFDLIEIERAFESYGGRQQDTVRAEPNGSAGARPFAGVA